MSRRGEAAGGGTEARGPRRPSFGIAPETYFATVAKSLSVPSSQTDVTP
jgi:hypothetical protein